MASGDRQRHSRSQSTSEVEASSPIFVAASAPLLEGPTLAGLSEAGPSEMDLSGIIIFFI